jgi:hypothetical protein
VRAVLGNVDDPALATEHRRHRLADRARIVDDQRATGEHHRRLRRVHELAWCIGIDPADELRGIEDQLHLARAADRGGGVKGQRRVALKFDVKGIGTIDAIGWVLWQRMDDCELPGDTAATLPKGFGVLFEAIPMETRQAIAALVAKHAAT